MTTKNYFFNYTDSTGTVWKIEYQLNEYLNLMTLIFDRGYEDWGDCRGRAWCGTCHILTIAPFQEKMDNTEKHTLSLLPNKTENSRLACQIPLNTDLHQKHIHFLGDFEEIVA